MSTDLPLESEPNLRSDAAWQRQRQRDPRTDQANPIAPKTGNRLSGRWISLSWEIVRQRFLTGYALMMSAEGDLRWYEVWQRPWRASDAAAFTSGRYDALSIVARAKTLRYPDLGFLTELTGLRELDLRARVADDSAAFDLIGLQGMLLATGCKVPFDGGRLRALRGLALVANRDVAGIAAMPWLREVTLLRWGGSDLALLGDKPELTYLRLDCRGQSINPAALAACHELEDVHLNNGRLGELTPVSGHERLRRIAAIGPKGLPSMDNPVSLSPLVSLPSLRWIELIRQPPIVSLAVAGHAAAARDRVPGHHGRRRRSQPAARSATAGGDRPVP